MMLSWLARFYSNDVNNVHKFGFYEQLFSPLSHVIGAASSQRLCPPFVQSVTFDHWSYPVNTQLWVLRSVLGVGNVDSQRNRD